MKFEHLLQLYWTKGYLVGGKLLTFHQENRNFIKTLNGFNTFIYLILLKRFELNALLTNADFTFTKLMLDERKILNIFFARILTVNNNIFDYNYLNLIKLYLIKHYRARCQAIGKPAHGQRTWSNAWTAYKYNKTIRLFINKSLKDTQSLEADQAFKTMQKKKQLKKKKTVKIIPIKNQIFLKKKNINLWV